MMEEIERTVPLMIDRPEYDKNSGQYELGEEVADLEDDEEIDVARKLREKKRSCDVRKPSSTATTATTNETGWSR